MPGFITHYICGQAVIKSLPAAANKIIKRHACIYNMGTQGPDIFFYYLPGLVNKRTRGIGVTLHRKRVGAFLSVLMDCAVQAEKGEARDILFSYVAGYLTHYALDAGTHPYVYARSAQEGKGKSAAIKQSVNHRKFETAIDILMLKLLSSGKPADYRLWHLVRADATQARHAAAAVSRAIHSAYARDVSPNDVYKAMSYMVQLTRLLQSKAGRRKRLMALAEHLTFGENVVTSVIHSQEVEDGVDYLNVGKAPWSKRVSHTDSFIDLYRTAVADAEEMITLFYGYTQGNITQRQLLARIGGRSLATGAEGV